MLPEQQLFAGGAMSPTAGMAMNPLLQGFGSYQNMQNDFTDRGLNQQSQDIQNQQQQNILQQSLLDNPNHAAQRDVTAGTIANAKTLLPDQLATAQAENQQKQSDAFAKMSSNDITKAENLRSATVDIAQDMKDDPSYLMHPEKWQAAKKRLEANGATNLPDTPDPAFLQHFESKAQIADQDLATIRKARQTEAANKQATSIENLKGGYQVKAAEAGAQRALNLQQNMLPDDVKVMKQASDEYANNKGVLSETTYEQAYNVLKNKNRADQNLLAPVKTAVDRLMAYSDKELATQAKKMGIQTDATDRGSIEMAATTQLTDKVVEQRTMNDLAQRFPGAKVQQPDGKIVPVQDANKTAPVGTTVTPTTGAATGAAAPTPPAPPTNAPPGSLGQAPDASATLQRQLAAGAFKDMKPEGEAAKHSDAHLTVVNGRLAWVWK